eukprot:6191913-Pleurochrysis_carterae.AAC.5
MNDSPRPNGISVQLWQWRMDRLIRKAKKRRLMEKPVSRSPASEEREKCYEATRTSVCKVFTPSPGGEATRVLPPLRLPSNVRKDVYLFGPPDMRQRTRSAQAAMERSNAIGKPRDSVSASNAENAVWFDAKARCLARSPAGADGGCNALGTEGTVGAKGVVGIVRTGGVEGILGGSGSEVPLLSLAAVFCVDAGVNGGGSIGADGFGHGGSVGGVVGGGDRGDGGSDGGFNGGRSGG